MLTVGLSPYSTSRAQAGMIYIDMNRGTERSGSPSVALRLKAGQIRYGVNWQGNAIKMQYERLAANAQVNPEATVAETLNHTCAL